MSHKIFQNSNVISYSQLYFSLKKEKIVHFTELSESTLKKADSVDTHATELNDKATVCRVCFEIISQKYSLE